jgi:hypothetical protein
LTLQKKVKAKAFKLLVKVKMMKILKMKMVKTSVMKTEKTLVTKTLKMVKNQLKKKKLN